MVGLAILVLRTTQVLHWLFERKFLGPLVLGVLPLGLMVAVESLLKHEVGSVAWPIVAVVGVLGLVLSVFVLWPSDDPIVDPRQAAQPGRSAVSWVTIWLFPILALLVGLVTWLMS